MKSNIFNLAVAIVIGVAFGKIVTSFVEWIKERLDIAETKECVHCLSIIPTAASKCGHCTADLPLLM